MFRTGKKCTVLDLLRSRKLVKYTISQVTTGIGINVVGNILLYNIQDLVLSKCLKIWIFIRINKTNSMSLKLIKNV